MLIGELEYPEPVPIFNKHHEPIALIGFIEGLRGAVRGSVPHRNKRPRFSWGDSRSSNSPSLRTDRYPACLIITALLLRSHGYWRQTYEVSVPFKCGEFHLASLLQAPLLLRRRLEPLSCAARMYLHLIHLCIAHHKSSGNPHNPSTAGTHRYPNGGKPCR